jgi:hypothetical protein
MQRRCCWALTGTSAVPARFAQKKFHPFHNGWLSLSNIKRQMGAPTAWYNSYGKHVSHVIISCYAGEQRPFELSRTLLRFSRRKTAAHHFGAQKEISFLPSCLVPHGVISKLKSPLYFKAEGAEIIIWLRDIIAAEFASSQIDSPGAGPIVVHLRRPHARPPARPRRIQTVARPASGEKQSNMSSQRQINSQENSYTPLSPPSPLTFFLFASTTSL